MSNTSCREGICNQRLCPFCQRYCTSYGLRSAPCCLFYYFSFLQPVVFLHGGPGGGTSASNRKFFDPNFYRIILFDQVCDLNFLVYEANELSA